MSKYIITITNAYEVEADSPEQALASYRVVFDNHEPELLGLTPEQVIEQDAFEFIGGKGEVEEASC